MISIETDSHGRVYQIWKQAQQSSCGVACCWMARGIAMQMSFAEDEWNVALRVYQAAVNQALGPVAGAAYFNPARAELPMCFNPDAFPNDRTSLGAALANGGFDVTHLVATLQGDGLRVDHQGANGNARVVQPNKIAANKPAIALVRWGDAGGGGHFVVVGRATRREVTYLDPWNGHINQQINDGFYDAPYGRSGPVTQLLYISA